MKILMIDQIAKVNYKYTYSLANAISKRNHEVILVIDQKKEKENCDCRKINLFNTDEKNIGKIKKLLNYIQSYRKIGRELREKNYDILHTQWTIFSPVDFFFLKKMKKKNNIKLITTIHDILPFNQKFYDYYFHKKIYTLVDSVIVQADNNVERFDSLFPLLKGKEVVIPHGHFLSYAEIIDKDIARQHLNIPSDRFVFLFFGQIKKVKGLTYLLEAYSEIYKNFPQALLVIAGSVWKDDFSQYQRIIDKYKGMDKALSLNIRYIPDDEIKYYYASSDCCVLPYTDVYQSGVIQLAYAYQKSVIATRIGAFSEVVIDGETGYLCNPNDSSDLAKTMKKALDYSENLQLMGKRGKKLIEKKFSWDDIADKVIEEYLK